MNIYEAISLAITATATPFRFSEAHQMCRDWLATIATIAPNWADAPDWAQWWAVDANGEAGWSAEKPQVTTYGTWLANGMWEKHASLVLPLGYDWRCTLRERPR